MIALMALTQQAQLLLESGQEAKARPVLAQALEAGAVARCNPSSVCWKTTRTGCASNSPKTLMAF